MKAIGYVRVSTQGQADEGVSLEAQKDKIAAWCELNGYELVDIFVDTKSGATEIDKRPGLMAALDAAKENKVDALVVVKRDRLARDYMIAGMVERLFEKVGSKVITTDGAGNGDNPEDMLLRGIQDVFAQYERMLIKVRTRVALAHKKAKGERVGTIPYGYKLASNGITLEPESTEKQVMALIQDLRGEGYTLKAIADQLNEDGIYNRRGNNWSHQSIHKLLKAA